MSTDKNPSERRRFKRIESARGSKVLTEIRNGERVNAELSGYSVEGGVGLLFAGDPKLSVGETITVWQEDKPKAAEVCYVLRKLDKVRVGAGWLDNSPISDLPS